MKPIRDITVNVGDYLSANKYDVDEEHAHIVLVPDAEREEFLKLVRVCPAALYHVDSADTQTFDYAGCLECGTCRIAAGSTIIAEWTYPQPTKGIEYRYG